MGRSAVFRPAMASTRNGLNIGGVGVMVKHPRKVREIFPTMKCEHFTRRSLDPRHHGRDRRSGPPH
eukprot:15484515-Heterocapsa_arctica.AAC.1